MNATVSINGLCSGEWYEAVFSDMLTKESLLVKVRLFHLLCRTN